MALASDEERDSAAATASASASGCNPFSGLVICVSGLSREARKQVMEATQRLGGTYTPNLHSDCTHLVVQSLGGRKLQHMLNHGFLIGHRHGPLVVTLGWFIDSVNCNVKLSETPYIVQSLAQAGFQEEDQFIPMAVHHACTPVSLRQNEKQSEKNVGQKHWCSGGRVEVSKASHLYGRSIYVDMDVSSDLHSKVVDVAAQEGAVLVDRWFVGCGASYVVCEESSIQRYLGHSDYIVSPIWVLKTANERSMQRFVGLSADLARQMGVMLENLKHVTAGQETWKEGCHEHICSRSRVSLEKRRQVVNVARCSIRNRRARRLQSCQVPLRPLNPSSLLDSICWSISEPVSRAAVYADSLTSKYNNDINKCGLFVGGDSIEAEASFSNLLRPLTESEKFELVFKNHFLTILYPVDRFAELGPSSRTYYSCTGFTCLHLLELIYAFYQTESLEENMPDGEIEVAIHTDSRHAERLRSVYCSERTEEVGYMVHKRIEFLGSRKSFEMLKRISGDNNSNVYELLIRE